MKACRKQVEMTRVRFWRLFPYLILIIYTSFQANLENKFNYLYFLKNTMSSTFNYTELIDAWIDFQHKEYDTSKND